MASNLTDTYSPSFEIFEKENFPSWNVLDIACQDDLIYITPDYQFLGQGIIKSFDLTLSNDDSRRQFMESLKNFEFNPNTTNADLRQFIVKPDAISFLPLNYDISTPSIGYLPQRLIYLQNNGKGWQLTFGKDVTSFSQVISESTDNRLRNPDGFELTSTVDHEVFKDNVADIVNEIKNGSVAKVVLARRVEITANRPFCKITSLKRLKVLYPTCTIFSMDGFIGASPELLLQKFDNQINLKPLAGTIASSGNQESDNFAIDELMASVKNRNEHSLVVEWLKEKLAALCTKLDASNVPDILTLRNVIHLATPMLGELKDADDTLLDITAVIHPTPAVGGVPDNAFRSYQLKYELCNRERYAGPIGWINSSGDGEFYLGIRSAQILESSAIIWAGVGIVENSNPEAELTETQLKFQAMLSCLVRP